MSNYQVPEKFYFRIHHVRPRFKKDIENVLFYVAEEISFIGKKHTDIFKKKLNAAIARYPGNARVVEKTINNWRTEISTLFGFIQTDGEVSMPSRRALELARKQDLVEFFKIFLYTFQYPGGHIKPKDALEQIKLGVAFKPAQYILQVLKVANTDGGSALGITKAEVCHCIFNDLRVTRDKRSPADTWKLITDNRKNKVDYDWTGDVIRYAGDIIDYMEIANLLKTYDSKMYYLNTLEEESVIKFVESKEWFSLYDKMMGNPYVELEAVKACSNKWFEYVNRDIKNTDFSTDILAYIAENEDDLQMLKSSHYEAINYNEDDLTIRSKLLDERIGESGTTYSTKDIGDIGEYLVHGHECMRLKLMGAEKYIHLVKKIPTQLAVGYDISSVEVDGKKRYIEVKTTISNKPMHFNRVHLTKNEWNTADSVRNCYYVYRLLLSRKEKKLFLLRDPVGLYKKEQIEMVPNDGADVTFNPKVVGKFEELLTWKN